MSKIPLIKNRWSYSIRKNKGKGLLGYGYSITMYKNGKRLASQPTTTAFGMPSIAAQCAKRIMLSIEFDIDI